MAHIKEPYGIDFVVENRGVTQADKEIISDIISHYKKTGHVKKAAADSAIKSGRRSSKRKAKGQTV